VNWYAASVDRVREHLGTGPDGLADADAEQRLAEHGPNRIRQGKEISAWEVLLHQFTSPLIYVLLGALVVTLSISSYADAIVIAAVLLTNGTVGFLQEYRAESAVQSLTSMITPSALVVRGGEPREIDSAALVPGDVVELQQGRMVPADLRLTEVESLQVNEAALTGESTPVTKTAETLADDPDLPRGDQTNLAFLGTGVTSGRARGVVVATGRATAIGEIAAQVGEAAEIETPLEQRIRQLTRWITVGILGVAVVAMGVGMLTGHSFTEMLLLGIALSVAAIPAGLPIVVTVALALGVRRMARRHALIRQLPAVDTLGSTTVIVTDKTGTLTQNQMTVRAVDTLGETYRVGGGGETTAGQVTREESAAAAAGGEAEAGRQQGADAQGSSPQAGPQEAADAAAGEAITVEEGSPLWQALLVGTLCSEASFTEDDDGFHAQGDPMEVALQVAAAKAGLDRGRLQERFERTRTVPFQTERRYMATIHDTDQGPLTLVKGAPETVLAMCDRRLAADGEDDHLDADAVRQAQEDLAAQGLRVLAGAVGRGQEVADATGEEQPTGLAFAGLYGLLDPPRQSAIEAVDRCNAIGIRVVMVTGDHARTAAAIAEKTHVDTDDAARADLDRAYSGRDLRNLDDDQFRRVTEHVNVFARAEPGQKLRLVDALKEDVGEIVAVTGDGVNDAPALKSAHIGAAMGSGTDVAKDASDMVITDDNFASVLAAVEEGRTSFRNIRMATFFLLSTGAADVLIILTALAVGWPLPLLPAQILWCNVVTNGIADVALAFEPGEKQLFRQPPRDPDAGVLNRLLMERLVIVGVWLAAGVLFMFQRTAGPQMDDLEVARTAALTTLVLFQKVHVFNCRSEHVSIFKKSLLANPLLLIGVLTSLGIHVAAMYIPVTQDLLRLTPLSGETWLTAIAVALTAILVNEAHKTLRAAPGGDRSR
jgi:Ca2+-transporting ATPase